MIYKKTRRTARLADIQQRSKKFQKGVDKSQITKYNEHG